MAFLDRLFPRRSDALAAGGQVRKSGGYSPVSEVPGQLWGRPQSSSGVRVDEFEALTLSAVFAACLRLANIGAMLPLGVYQKGENGRREELPEHPAAKLLGVAPNPEQTAFTARHFLQFWKPLFGAACAEIGWDGAGRSRRLWPLEPWRVRPDWDVNDQLFFRVDGTRKVAASDMIYVPHVTEDGVTGKGFVEFALESLGQAISADRSAGRFFQNDMKPGGILQHDGNPSAPTRKEFREEWARNHGGVENRGKTGVLWGGWKWMTAGMQIEPDKAQLLETRQYSVDEVARWLNVPPHWLAQLARATFCLPGDSMVSTEFGPKPIADVRVGEMVWSRSGSEWMLSRVMASACTGEADVLEIKTGVRTLRCTANHRVPVRRMTLRPHDKGPGVVIDGVKYRKTWDVIWVEASQVRLGDELLAANGFGAAGKRSCPTREHVTEGFMEALGMIVGDGYFARTKHKSKTYKTTFGISHGEGEDYLAHYVATIEKEFVAGDGPYAMKNGGRQPLKGKKRDKNTTVFYSSVAYDELDRLGIAGTAKTKQIPAWIFELADDLKVAFLRGYLDADGTVNAVGNVIYSSVNRVLLEQVRHLCMSVGIRCGNLGHADIESEFNGKKYRHTLWQLICAGDAGERIGSHSSFCRDRTAAKKNRKRRRVCKVYPCERRQRGAETGMIFARVQSIRSLGVAAVYDLNVKCSHTFVADGVLVHNSNIEYQSIEALIYCVSPMLIGFEQEYDRKLLAPPKLYCKHNVNALLRTDAKSRGEFYRLMKEIGVFTTNQILAYEDENGIGADGDQRFVPVNWQPTDDLMTGLTAQVKVAKAKPQPAAGPAKGSKPPAAPGPKLAMIVPGASLVAAAESVAEQALTGFLRKEINEGRRAAKKVGEVTRWMDDFYPGFEGHLAAGLLATAGLALAVRGTAVADETASQLAGLWAGQWVKTSREQLLTAMECKAEEWPNRSAALFLAWEGRASTAAARVAEGIRDG